MTSAPIRWGRQSSPRAPRSSKKTFFERRRRSVVQRPAGDPAEHGLPLGRRERRLGRLRHLARLELELHVAREGADLLVRLEGKLLGLAARHVALGAVGADDGRGVAGECGGRARARVERVIGTDGGRGIAGARARAHDDGGREQREDEAQSRRQARRRRRSESTTPSAPSKAQARVGPLELPSPRLQPQPPLPFSCTPPPAPPAPAVPPKMPAPPAPATGIGNCDISVGYVLLLASMPAWIFAALSTTTMPSPVVSRCQATWAAGSWVRPGTLYWP